jgi:hypothetical protein
MVVAADSVLSKSVLGSMDGCPHETSRFDDLEFLGPSTFPKVAQQLESSAAASPES